MLKYLNYIILILTILIAPIVIAEPKINWSEGVYVDGFSKFMIGNSKLTLRFTTSECSEGNSHSQICNNRSLGSAFQMLGAAKNYISNTFGNIEESSSKVTDNDIFIIPIVSPNGNKSFYGLSFEKRF